MPSFCILWRQPKTRARIIIIYLAALHLTPHAALPLGLGGLLGSWLTGEPGQARLAYAPAGR
jgi:hypothetical protein